MRLRSSRKSIWTAPRGGAGAFFRLVRGPAALLSGRLGAACFGACGPCAVKAKPLRTGSAVSPAFRAFGLCRPGAELGATILSADLDLYLQPREDHAASIASWLKVLKNDKRAIFTAVSHAQRAADFLNGLQEQQEAPVLEAAE